MSNEKRGPNGGRLFRGQELCPICDCCSLLTEECEQCGDEGYDGHECGEDTCCCLDPEENEPCDICLGRGGFLVCLGGCDFAESKPHDPVGVGEAPPAQEPAK